MKNLVILALSVFMLISCNNQIVQQVVAQTTDASTDNTMPIEKDITYSDPALFGGCSFGNAFLSFIQSMDYSDALRFTSKESIEEHGEQNVLNFYKSIRVNYKLHLKSKSKDGDTIILRYTTSEFATRKLKDFVVVLQNDTCRLVLPKNLNDFLK